MLRKFVLLFGAHIVLGATLLFNTLLIARLLGPEGKGKVALLILVPTVLETMLTLGFHLGASYFLSRKEYPVHEVFGTVLGTAGLLGGASLVVALALGEPIRQVVYRSLSSLEVITSLASVPPLLLYFYFDGLWIAMDRMVAVISVRLIQGVVYFLSGVILVGMFGLGTWGGILAFTVGAYASAVMIVVWIIRITPHNLVFSLELFKRALRFGLAAYPGTLTDYALYRMDTYMIGYLLGFQSLGYYSIAVPLAELIWYLTAAIRPVLFARTAHAVAEEANVVTPTTMRGVLAIALILAGLIFSGGYLVVHLFIPAFTPALPVLAILLAATVMALIFQLVLAHLTSQGHGASASRIGIASLCCGVLFYLVLIPRLGIIGAAMASFLSYFLQSALSLLWFWKLTGLSPWQVLAPRQSDLVLVSDFVGRLARRVL